MASIIRDDKNKARKLLTVMREFPEFRFLRNLYYTIEYMYTRETYEEAKAVWEQWKCYLSPAGPKQYEEWCETYDFEEELFKPFQSFSQYGFQTYAPYILNYFKKGCRFTNATTEGLNNKIGRINHVGNGYSFRHLRAKVLFAPLITNHIRYGVKLSSIPVWEPTTEFTTSFTISPGKYVKVGKFVFTHTTEAVEYKPINIYEPDDFLDSIFVPRVTEPCCDVDADSLTNAEWPDE